MNRKKLGAAMLWSAVGLAACGSSSTTTDGGGGLDALSGADVGPGGQPDSGGGGPPGTMHAVYMATIQISGSISASGTYMTAGVTQVGMSACAQDAMGFSNSYFVPVPKPLRTPVMLGGHMFIFGDAEVKSGMYHGPGTYMSNAAFGFGFNIDPTTAGGHYQDSLETMPASLTVNANGGGTISFTDWVDFNDTGRMMGTMKVSGTITVTCTDAPGQG